MSAHNPWEPLPPGNEKRCDRCFGPFTPQADGQTMCDDCCRKPEFNPEEAKITQNMHDIMLEQIKRGELKPSFRCQVFKGSWWQGGGYYCKAWHKSTGWIIMAWFKRPDWANAFQREFAVEMCEQLVPKKKEGANDGAE